MGTRKYVIRVVTQAIPENGHCRGFSYLCWESITQSDRTSNKLSSNLMESPLTDLEAVPSEITCRRRFEELLGIQVRR